jgi:Predicted transcriptional regulators
MNQLRILREQKNLTQSKMAEIIGFTKSHYTKIEIGVRNPGFKFLKALKDNFPEVDMNEIFK